MLLGAAVLSAAILAAWFPASSLLRQRANLASATTQLHQLHQQDAALAQERKNLSSSAEIARIAREQYQLVNPGQSAYQVLPPSGSTNGAAGPASDPASGTPVAPSASVELPPGGTTATTQPGGTTKATSGGGSSSLVSRMLHALEFWR
jgi:cell division protein FtsB